MVEVTLLALLVFGYQGIQSIGRILVSSRHGLIALLG